MLPRSSGFRICARVTLNSLKLTNKEAISSRKSVCTSKTTIYTSGSQPFFHLRTPGQPISINYTIHIIKIFVIDIAAVISNLHVVTVN